MDLSKKKVLITGADGFIGSHLTEELLEHYGSVRAFCYYNSFNSLGWLDAVEKETLNQIDIFMGEQVGRAYDSILLAVGHQAYQNLALAYFRSIAHGELTLFDLKGLY